LTDAGVIVVVGVYFVVNDILIVVDVNDIVLISEGIIVLLMTRI